jgi:hypothetical protein
MWGWWASPMQVRGCGEGGEGWAVGVGVGWIGALGGGLGVLVAGDVGSTGLTDGNECFGRASTEWLTVFVFELLCELCCCVRVWRGVRPCQWLAVQFVVCW